MHRFEVITIFPKMFSAFLTESIIKRAQEKKKVMIRVHDLRDYSSDKHRKVDDRPFGGGPGMVMTPQPFFDAVAKVKGKREPKIICLCPSGRRLDQRFAKKLVKTKDIILLCGHYEGIDERVRRYLADESVSVGDYVLTGGELPSMVLMDCLIRLIPGVLGKEDSLHSESFENNLLEYPQYTRPANFRGRKVPSVLLSGHHKAIEEWRQEQAVVKTKKRRPDLILE